MAGEPFRAEVGILQRNRAIFGAALSLLLLGLLLFTFGVLGHAPLAEGVGPMVFMSGVLAILLAAAKNPNPRVMHGLVEANREGVRFDGAMKLRRDVIAEGFVVPRHSLRPIVRLVRKRIGPPLEVVVHDEAHGRALLRALSLDASQTVARIKLPSQLSTNRMYRIGSIVGAGTLIGLIRAVTQHGVLMAAIITLSVGLIFAVSLLLTSGRLEVGADGIATSRLGRKRFVRYADLESFDRYVERSVRKTQVWGLKLQLQSGEELKIPVGTQSAFDDSKMAAILVQRVREALESFKRGDVAADAALVRRGARDVPAWVRQLRAIGAGANAAMRTAPVDADRLWRIVENPSAEASARAGAAVALKGDLDAQGVVRLRAVAKAIAEPKVRIAIEAAASDGGDEELVEALGQLDADHAETRSA